MSHIHIAENCGLLDNLLPGDHILTDRKFNKHAGIFCAEVKMPAFTKWKKKLSQAEIDTSRQMIRVCIHIERAILGSTTEVLTPC